MSNTIVKIFSPAKNAMQSGRANAGQLGGHWVMQVMRQQASLPNGEVGWSGSADTKAQVQLQFDSLELAREYAVKHGWGYEIMEPNTRKVKPKLYADNFAFNRVIPWTH